MPWAENLSRRRAWYLQLNIAELYLGVCTQGAFAHHLAGKDVLALHEKHSELDMRLFFQR